MSRCEDCPDPIRIMHGDDSDSYLYDNRPHKAPVVINSDRHIVGQIVRHESTTPQSSDSANEKR